MVPASAGPTQLELSRDASPRTGGYEPQLRDRAREAALLARLHPAKADLIGGLRATGAG
jgi:hypothetical protein